MRELKVEARSDCQPQVAEFVEGELAKLPGIARKDILKIHMVVDEIFGNIVNYAYDGEAGSVTVRTDLDGEAGEFILTFIDEGRPYDPLSNEDPDVTLSARERTVGGLGIFMVKQTMDDIRYENRDGKNILTLIKKAGG